MKTLLTASIMTAAITLVPTTSFANSDDSKYPAANFQPKVIYFNKEAAKEPAKYVGEKSVYDPKYPAANFEPKVIYP